MSIKVILILAILMVCEHSHGSAEHNDFHRLLIFNEKNQLLVVKIKNTDFWVTPGLYAANNDSINNRLHHLAAEYGMTLTQPQLRGQFILKNKKTDESLIRYFYTAHINKYQPKIPGVIDLIKWLPVTEAMDLITFPHIKLLSKQVIDHPDSLWSGTVLRFKENSDYKAEMVKPFYKLAHN